MQSVDDVVGEKSKYPSTPHLPFSPQVNADDIVVSAAAASGLLGCPVVVTEKLDGGNCCLCDGKVCLTVPLLRVWVIA